MEYLGPCKTIKQHYVPQFYLRYFEDSSHKIYIHNHSTGYHGQSRAKDICWRDKLYETESNCDEFIQPNQIENEFGRHESEYNRVIKKIKNICLDFRNEHALICNSAEKECLASFVTNMFLRNPLVLKDAEDHADLTSLMSSEEIQSMERVLEALNFGIELEPLVRHANKRCWIDEKISGNANMPTRMINNVKRMHMTFLIAHESHFVTSSFPVIAHLTKSNSFAELDFENLFIPLSPQIGLGYSKNDTMQKLHNRVTFVGSDDVANINRLYWSQGKLNSLFTISHNIDILNDLREVVSHV